MKAHGLVESDASANGAFVNIFALNLNVHLGTLVGIGGSCFN